VLASSWLVARQQCTAMVDVDHLDVAYLGLRWLLERGFAAGGAQRCAATKAIQRQNRPPKKAGGRYKGENKSKSKGAQLKLAATKSTAWELGRSAIHNRGVNAERFARDSQSAGTARSFAQALMAWMSSLRVTLRGWVL